MLELPLYISGALSLFVYRPVKKVPLTTRQFKQQHNFKRLLCLFVVDLTTSLALNSVLGHYFPLRRSLLIHLWKKKCFWVCCSTSFILKILQFLFEFEFPQLHSAPLKWIYWLIVLDNACDIVTSVIFTGMYLKTTIQKQKILCIYYLITR